jgi:outer membrane lipoprotein SlyB
MHVKTPEQITISGLYKIGGRILLVVTLAVPMGACTMTETQQRTGSGAAIGAVAGGLLGGRKGAAIGAAVGAGGGYVVDQQKKRESAEAENQRLREENEQLRQQQ